MNYNFPVEMAYPIGVAVSFPVILLIVTRVAALRSRNAAQFFMAALLQVALWVFGSLALPEGYRPSRPSDWALGAIVLAGALLFVLEVWALLSRGYTLAMLMTLLRSAAPLGAEEMAARYRSSAGLDWIMQHRVGGLKAVRLVRSEGGYLVLTRRIGICVAVAYRAAIALFGLRRTG